MKINNLSVKNFGLFNDFEYCSCSNMNIIYGENGIGKTTFITVFEFLDQVFNYYSLRLKFIDVLDDISNNSNTSKVLSSSFNLHENFATLNSHDPIIIRFDFEHKSKNGTYEIHLSNNSEVIYEKLEYAIKVRKKILYRLEEGKIYFSDELKDYYKLNFQTIKDNKTSIINFFEFFNKASDIKSLMKSNETYNFLITFSKMFNNSSEFTKSNFRINHFLIPPRHTVKISEYENFKKQIEIRINQLNDFIFQIDSKINSVEYEIISENNDNITVELFFSRTINSKIIKIPFHLESSGTQRYISFFEKILKIKSGSKIITIDEFGLHLHENLKVRFFDLLTEACTKNNCQLFLTTHEVSFLENPILKNENKFIIRHINGGLGQEVYSLKGKNIRENNKTSYINGFYGSSPIRGHIFIDE